MDSQSPSSMPTYTHADFLEQAALAQSALAKVVGYMDIEEERRDDDVARLLMNKAMKFTVRPLQFLIFFILTFFLASVQ